MIKKTIILAMMLVSILLLSTYCVTADEIKEEINDDEDDVMMISIDSEDITTTDKKPNIDITKIEYHRENQNEKSVTLTLEVNSRGHIEDSGDENNLVEPMVFYMIVLETSESVYMVFYMNDFCTLDDEEVTPSVIDNRLSLTFDLNSVDETFASLSAETAEMNLITGGEYYDSAPDIDESLIVDIDGPSTGKVGEAISFTGSIDDGGSSIYDWEWSFGDGETLSEENQTDTTFTVTHTYTEAGTYNVYLDVIDYNYNYGTAVFTINITANQNDNNNGDNNHDGDNDNDVAGNQDSSETDSSYLLFFGLIILIVVIGASVLVVIIKR